MIFWYYTINILSALWMQKFLQLQRHVSSRSNVEYRCVSRCLTHWGLVTHICFSKLSIIGSDNGLSPDRHQAIIWNNNGILFIGTLGTNFNEILIEINAFSFKNVHLKMSSGKWRPYCLGLNVLRVFIYWTIVAMLFSSPLSPSSRDCFDLLLND